MPMKRREEHKGFLIAFEGIDGAGKTTQATILYDKLKQEKFDVCFLHEPTESRWGKKIDELAKNGRHNVEPKKEFELFYLDRKKDVKDNILPALKKNKIVIMDRYYFSSVAYQGALGLDPNFIEKENEKIAPKPLLTIILDVSPRVALSRVKNRTKTPNHFERERYLAKVREIFRKRFDGRTDVVILDGTQGIDTVAAQIMNILLPILRDRWKSEKSNNALETIINY